MGQDSRYLLNIKSTERGYEVSFNNVRKLTVLQSETLRQRLLELAEVKYKELAINLCGIQFIDNAVIDIFNLLSRVARKYNSAVLLTEVSDNVLELIELIKVHAVFDIKHVFPALVHKSVA